MEPIKPGDMVRYRRQRGCVMWSRAMVVEVRKATAVVAPINHGKLEQMDLAVLRPWKKGNAMRGADLMRRVA